MHTVAITRTSVERQTAQGRAAARRRAADLWDHWLAYDTDIEDYVEAMHDAAATVSAGPAPQAFKDAYFTAAQTCIEKVTTLYHEVYVQTITIAGPLDAMNADVEGVPISA
jgi:hypothetical protein